MVITKGGPAEPERRLSPDCEIGKHGACNGDAFDWPTETVVPCECPLCPGHGGGRAA